MSGDQPESGGRSSKFLSLALVALLAALTIGVFANARRSAAPAEVRPEVGYAAPPLVYTADGGVKRPLVDIKGKPVRLEDFRGKVVFINFWASWCGPCRREMPEIQRLNEEYADRVKVLAVNATAQDDETKARQFVRQLSLTLDVPLDRTGEVTDAYRVIFFPSTFVVDPSGVVRVRREGAMNYSMMESAVLNVLR